MSIRISATLANNSFFFLIAGWIKSRPKAQHENVLYTLKQLCGTLITKVEYYYIVPKNVQAKLILNQSNIFVLNNF